MPLAIETRRLGRVFKERGRLAIALEGVDLSIEPGELFGLLGPNGAGKTTLIKILTTLLLPSTGQAFVDGLDVVRQPNEVRWRINAVAGGETVGYGLLTVRENLWLWSQLYGLSYRLARQRIDYLLDVVGLSAQANTRANHLSTGMRQKMNFIRGLVSDPRVLFLDEPTVGLDVTSAIDVRAYIRAWVQDRAGRLPGAAPGPRTVLLTTHYLHEADELCDRIAIIDGGRILACDTPANLKRLVQRESVFALQVEGDSGGWESLAGLRGVHQVAVERQDGRVHLRLMLEDDAALPAVITAITARPARLRALSKVEPTLEEAFVQVTGRKLGEAQEAR